MRTLDTIYIELVVTAAKGKDIWMQGDIEIRIGNQKPYNEEDIVDTFALLESMESDGEYFIFSCVCGLPECSGWNKGIIVSHQENTIKWIDPNNGKDWLFNKNSMLEDIANIRTEVAVYKQYFKEKGISYVGVGYDW